MGRANRAFWDTRASKKSRALRKERYHQAWRYVKISLQDLRLSWQWDRHALRLAASRDRAYLLRTNLEGSDPGKLWTQYIQLTEVEAVFRALKSDLAIRPIWHFSPKRIEAHIMVAFLEKQGTGQNGAELGDVWDGLAGRLTFF